MDAIFVASVLEKIRMSLLFQNPRIKPSSSHT